MIDAYVHILADPGAVTTAVNEIGELGAVGTVRRD